MRKILLVSVVGAAVALAFAAMRETPLAAKPEKEPPAIGTAAGDIKFKDIQFKERRLSEPLFKNDKGFVFVAVNNGCPLVPRYFPTLTRLEKEFRDKGIRFFALNVGLDETILEMAKQATDYDVSFPFVKDIDGNCAERLGLSRTPEVVVLNAERKIVYRGRIDDQYSPGKSLPKPTREDLREALDELNADKKVSVPETACAGCKIAIPGTAPDETKVTFAEHIAPLLHKKCVECHKSGGLAPFSLGTFEQAEKRAEAILEAVADGQMPPWYATSSHVKFSNAKTMTAAERALVARWVRAGKPRGDETKFPLPAIKGPKKDEWQFGEPDLILSTNVEEIPAEGDVPYRYAVLPHTFLNDTYIQSIEIKPDKPGVVHHANLLYGSLTQLKFNEDLFITGYVPGNVGANYDEGMAYKIPALARLMFQIHFVSTGKPEKCRIQVGIRFPRVMVHQTVKHVLLDIERFRIPANTVHKLTVTEPLKEDVIAVAGFVHMHKRGKSMVFKAQPPGEEEKTLISVPNYSFDWQMPYRTEPGTVRLPKGTKLTAEAVYDNTAFNSLNSDPNRIVPSGFQTYNEMMQGFFFYVSANEDLKLELDPKTGTVPKKKKN